MPEVVLDASALLALLNGEPGAEVVASALPQAASSALNLSEVVAKLADAGMPDNAIRDAIQGLSLELYPLTWSRRTRRVSCVPQQEARDHLWATGGALVSPDCLACQR